MRKTVLLCMVVFSVLFSAHAQVLDLLVSPRLDIPVGPLDSGNISRFGLGGGAAVEADYRLPFLPFVQALALAGYDLVTLNAAGSPPFSIISLGVGARAAVQPVPILSLDLSAGGGYGMIMFKGGVYGNPFIMASAGFSFAISPVLSLGLSAAYHHFFGSYYDLSVNLGTTVHFGVDVGSKVHIKSSKLNPVFPVFYSYYDTHQLGELVLRNDENDDVSEVQVSLYVKQFMDKPKLCTVLKDMKKGEEKTVPLYGLFTDSILKVTEGTQVSAEILVEYKLFGKAMSATKTDTLRVENRNAMTWDDDRKAASFVTARDPSVLQYAKTIGGAARDSGSGRVNIAFCEAMGLFESLSIFGLNYIVDPKSAYTETSKSGTVVDYLQFPAQTLRYKAGDCDDLSILYCALLESIGVETAFITIPGHIFMAFCLDMPVEDARSLFSAPQDLIVQDDKVWIPVEITMIQGGFVKAWQEGANEWRQSSKGGSAHFYPMAQAWEQYQPTGMDEGGPTVALPDQKESARKFSDAITAFARREVSERATKLQQEASQGSSPKSQNALGALYARFGLLDEAKAAFQKAADAGNVAAFVNLGNLAYLRKDFQSALTWYGRASEKNAVNATALLGMAKASYELGNMSAMRDAYAKLVAVAPATAEKYGYLVGTSADTGRASGQDAREGVLWADAN